MPTNMSISEPSTVQSVAPDEFTKVQQSLDKTLYLGQSIVNLGRTMLQKDLCVLTRYGQKNSCAFERWITAMEAHCQNIEAYLFARRFDVVAARRKLKYVRKLKWTQVYPVQRDTRLLVQLDMKWSFPLHLRLKFDISQPSIVREPVSLADVMLMRRA